MLGRMPINLIMLSEEQLDIILSNLIKTDLIVQLVLNAEKQDAQAPNYHDEEGYLTSLEHQFNHLPGMDDSIHLALQELVSIMAFAMHMLRDVQLGVQVMVLQKAKLNLMMTVMSNEAPDNICERFAKILSVILDPQARQDHRAAEQAWPCRLLEAAANRRNGIAPAVQIQPAIISRGNSNTGNTSCLFTRPTPQVEVIRLMEVRMRTLNISSDETCSRLVRK